MKGSKLAPGPLVLAGTLLVAGCSGDSGSDEDLGLIQQPLPAGSNAQFVSSTIPLAMSPGERLFVQTSMQNTGAASPANDWSSTYSLSRVSTAWSWVSTPVRGTVSPGSTHTFGYVITAPSTPNTYTYTARMRQDIQFGQTVSIPNIVVSNATQRSWACAYVPGSSTIPTMMAPGENRVVTVTVQNTGSQAWAASGLHIKTQDTPSALWGNVSNPLNVAVAPGATHSFNIAIKAPTTPGTYELRRQMTDGNATGVGFFDLGTPCVDVSINVAGATPLNAAIVSHNLPATMAPGEPRIVSVVMNNNGTATWLNDGTFGLYSKNVPTSLWGETSDPLVVTTAPAADGAFSFVITAPSTPGTYSHVWQMRKLGGVDAGFFGAILNVPVVVDASTTGQYGAVVTAQNVPLRITAGTAATFDITLQNTGTAAWSGTSFGLYSLNEPAALWGPTRVLLGSAETVAPSATRQFLIDVTAPTTPGTYSSLWRMRNAPSGVGYFGATATTSNIIVTLCGNGALDGGESCDDGNLTNGDGCSDLCQPEATIVDLAADAAGRTLTGAQTNRQLGTVAIGDVTNDGVPDVVVGENATFGAPLRNQAGRIFGYTGGAGFFDGSSSVVTSNPTFTMLGAEAQDGFGTYGGGSIVIGDVTGDSVADLIVSAKNADGAGNARDAAGEVYVFSGGASLAGTIDVAAAPASLTAVLIGAHANDQLRALAVADLTGDGFGDLVLGASDDTNGVNAGAIYIVAGGAGLAGSIDLLAPSGTIYSVLGAAAGDGVGSAVAIADFGGGAESDLLVGAPQVSPASGSAYAIFGPIDANHVLSNPVGSATGPDVEWFGTGETRLGTTVAAGNVTGTADADVAISAQGHLKNGVSVGAVNVWAGPLVSGTTYDLGASASQTAIIQGIDVNDGLGSSIRVADWTGDGVMDIAVAAYAADGPSNSRTNAGELTILRGGAGITGTIDLGSFTPTRLLVAYGATPSAQMGSRQITLAFERVDADGKADVCVGSPVAGRGRIDCFQAP